MLSAAGAGGGRGGGVPNSVTNANKAKQKKKQESLDAHDGQDVQENHKDGLTDQNCNHYANKKEETRYVTADFIKCIVLSMKNYSFLIWMLRDLWEKLLWFIVQTMTA